MPSEKIHKFIARCGICSRREAEELVAQGRVTVNGRKAVIGERIDPERDRVLVDGKPVKPVEEKIYLAFHKPAGVITTCEDEQGRTTVLDFLKKHFDLDRTRLFPVGRLDKNSTGLLVITNDGEFMHSILHPSRKIPKVYNVEVKGHPSRKKLAELEQGVVIEGRKTMPCEIEVLKRTRRTTRLKVILYEGRKRQIRKMMKMINHPVISLERVAIGPVKLGDMKPGSFRHLTEEELNSFKTRYFKEDTDGKR